MKNLFFYKLYLFDKRLFLLIVIFSSLTVLCNIKGDEITPFFIWAMYSEKESPVNKYQVYTVRINGDTLDYASGYTGNNRFFLTAPLSFYNKIKKNNFADPSRNFLQDKLRSKYAIIQPLSERVLNTSIDTAQFTRWYLRYLYQSTGTVINKLDVDVVNVHFTSSHQVQTDSSYSLIEWKQQ